jgi:hypothetical protein
MNKKNEYIAEYDGYGIVGYSFRCIYCNELNRFVDEEESEHVCSNCDKTNYFEPYCYG